MNVLPMAAVLFAAAGGVVVSTEAMRSRARKELKRSTRRRFPSVLPEKDRSFASGHSSPRRAESPTSGSSGMHRSCSMPFPLA